MKTTKEILGQRELSEDENRLMQEIADAGDALKKLHSRLMLCKVDQRWLSIGATDLQKGLMAWKRAVGQPDAF